MKLHADPKRLFQSLILLTLIMPLSNIALGIGIIIPIPIPRPQAAIPPTLKSVNVTSHIQNDIAKTRVTQVFHNPNLLPVEADFYFPTPDGADITDFILFMDGKPVKGEVLDKDKAQSIYRDIVRKLRDPGLVEWSGKNLFRVRLFPIPARGDQKIEIQITQPLTADQGYYRFNVPLKYPLHNGASSSPPTVDLQISIESDPPVRNVYSPTHKLETNTSDTRSLTVTVADDNPASNGRDGAHLVNQDFLLFYEHSDKPISVSLLSHKSKNTEGFFTLRISPPWDAQGTTTPQASPGNYVFVIDSSGSMVEGDKIEQARKALRYCVSLLKPTDRFNIVRFSTTVESFKPDLLPASPDNRRAAVYWIDELQARGGTNISEALKAALAQRKTKSSENWFQTDTTANSIFTVVFLTDGLPTVGETAPEAILKAVKEQSGDNVRIFTFGVGHDVNTRLLDFIANSTRAASEYVSPAADLEVPVSRFFDKISRPALFNLELKIPGVGVSEIYPTQLPDLFYGTELAVMGKYKTSGPSPIILSGTIAGKRQEYRFEKVFPDSNETNRFVEKLWATRKVAWLLDELRKSGESTELKKEIEETALKYSIVTPYTSYLAMPDEVPSAQPPDLRAGVADIRRKGRYKNSGRPSSADKLMSMSNFKAESGAGAVQAAQQVQQMKTAEIVPSTDVMDNEAVQKAVNGKLFINENGVWKDSAIAGTEKSGIKIKYLSDAWFQISETYPELRDYLAVGEQIQVLVADDMVLHIGPEGLDTIDNPTNTLLKTTIVKKN